jgi:hypothetical protein
MVLAAAPFATTAKRKKAPVKTEHFEILDLARELSTDRVYLLICGGGYRGHMFHYLEELIADGKAKLHWNPKHTSFRAKVYIGKDTNAVQTAAVLKQLASIQYVSLAA